MVTAVRGRPLHSSAESCAHHRSCCGPAAPSTTEGIKGRAGNWKDAHVHQQGVMGTTSPLPCHGHRLPPSTTSDQDTAAPEGGSPSPKSGVCVPCAGTGRHQEKWLQTGVISTGVLCLCLLTRRMLISVAHSPSCPTPISAVKPPCPPIPCCCSLSQALLEPCGTGRNSLGTLAPRRVLPGGAAGEQRGVCEQRCGREGGSGRAQGRGQRCDWAAVRETHRAATTGGAPAPFCVPSLVLLSKASALRAQLRLFANRGVVIPVQGRSSTSLSCAC